MPSAAFAMHPKLQAVLNYFVREPQSKIGHVATTVGIELTFYICVGCCHCM